MSETAELERHDFGAEVGRLLDLVVHSLYSDREIFLRELVANSADALDRRRFEALTDPALSPQADAKVRIVADKAARTLTIEDDGIGMTREELVANLGTIARSGTRAFGETLGSANAEDRPSLIGQFGVGFYSAFMVAERVEVTSRKAGAESAFTWASDGRGAFTIAPATRDRPGTTIVMHVKPDGDEFLEPVRLDAIVRKWADHITVPITVAHDGKDVAANEGTALWRKPKSEVSEASYTEFYRHLGHLFDSPWMTLHWRAEGALEFAALLYIPGSKPFQPMEEIRESRVRLHVRRMFITDSAALLPPWLRFVQGVVDTEDLPLNVSREMLQTTPVLARIRKAVTGRVIAELKTRAKDAKDYEGFWENFGPVMKEGAWEDSDHRKDLAPLLRFRSSSTEGWTSLPEYVARMRPGQEAIYILVGDRAESLAGSPQLEGFRAAGVEVLLLADPIDAFWPDRLDAFEGHPIRSITQAGDDLAKLRGDATPDTPDISKLTSALKALLKDDFADVQATDRLVESAVLLSAETGGPDLQMQRLLKRAGRTSMPLRPVLRVNPTHPVIRHLAELQEQGGELGEKALMLADLARVQEGEPPKDPAAFARRVTDLLAK